MVNHLIRQKKLKATKKLLTPTHIYAPLVMELINEVPILGMSHITGGGFYENLVRVLPDNLSIEIQKDSWEILPIFNLIKKLGKEDEREMFRVFNMGIGLCIMVPESIALFPNAVSCKDIVLFIKSNWKTVVFFVYDFFGKAI